MLERGERHFYRAKKGVALITALIFTLIISSLIGASLLYAQSHYSLAYANARSESALLLAEGGVNDEIQYIATHLNSTVIADLSSQPSAASGETEIYPGDGTVIKGRKGSVTGQPTKYFWVFSSNDEAGTTGWDGRQATFWITSAAKVEGSWRRVKVQVQAISIFSLNAIMALASYPNNSNAISLSAATVNVEGTGGTNGTVSNSSSTLILSDAINANTADVSTGQFTSANLASGGTIVTRTTPIVYPSVATVLKRIKGRASDTDAAAWTWLGTSANNSNNTGIYTYRDHPTSATINTTNCQSINLGLTTLGNSRGGTLEAWASAGYRPGTYVSSGALAITAASNASPIEITTSANHALVTGNSVFISGVTGNTAANGNWRIIRTGPKKFTLNGSTGNGTAPAGGTANPNLVQTLIFQPGDYYFTSLNLPYNYRTQIVIDTQALASGGTPGQVRFWLHDPANGNQNDSFQLPITTTIAAGGTVPDPALFRVYYSKDGKTFTFGRPPSVTSVNETTHLLEDLAGSFGVYGGVYAVTKLPGDTNTSLTGTQINFQGSTGAGGGTIQLTGSLLADKLSFQGPCSIIYQYAPNTSDPIAGAGTVGGYTDGG